MSQDVYTPTGRKLVIVAWVALPLLLLVAFLYVTLGKSGPTDVGKPPPGSVPEDNPLAAARALLAKRTDLGSCRRGVQQLNDHLTRAPEQRPAPLGAARARELGEEFGLGEDELAEVGSTSFTLLDAHHLHRCFLMNDAVEGLELRPAEGSGGKSVPQSGLEQAEAAFAWVVRQVRQVRPEDSPEPVPPAYALMRGWGTPLERALVFLSLLEQFGAEEGNSALQGCLLFLPGKDKDGPERFWACGVAVGAKPGSLYLFDPRLGLPLPGPKGEGVATLAQARSDPAVLKQLDVDKKHTYDVTAEQARAARAYLFCTLSELAPRMALLQDKLLRERQWKDDLLPAPVQVRLAVDPGRARGRLAAAVGKREEVGVWRGGAGLLRRFLPKEEGGSDGARDASPKVRDLLGFEAPGLVRQPRLQLYRMQLVPWDKFPRRFVRDPETFRSDIGLGRELVNVFGGPFVHLYTGPQGPRDLLLRGRHVKAANDLSAGKGESEGWKRMRATAGDLDKPVEEWLGRALHAHAELLRAKDPSAKQAAQRELAALWDKERGAAQPVLTLLRGAMADDYAAAVSYQLGLCKHEQAQRIQARLDLAVRAGADVRASERERARNAWEDPELMWREFTANYPKHPAAGAARGLLGEAQARRGERAEALASWRDLSGPLTELEKLANLLRARRLGARGAGG